MENDGLNNSLTDEEFFRKLTTAMEKDDTDTVNELMALQDQPKTEEAPAPEPVADPDEGEKNEPIVNEEPKGDDNKVAGDAPPAPSDPNLQQEPVKPQQTPEELLTAATERLKAVEGELHKYKSDAGRVPGLQRRMAELEKRLAAETQTSSPNVELTEEEQSALAQIRENDEDLASKLEKTLLANKKSLRQETTERQREIDLQEYDLLQAQHQEAEFNRLVARVPEAPQIFKSPMWSQWKASLKPSDRAYAESDNADEVHQALVWFHHDLQRYYASQAQPQADPAQQPVTPQPQQAAPPAPQAAPRPRASVSAQKGGGILSEDEQYKQIWDEVGKAEGYQT